MSQSLALQTIQPDEWTTMTQMAAALVKTKFLPQAIQTPEQAVAIMLTGRELGLPPMAALSQINVIQGKPTLSAELMLALINRSRLAENIEIVATVEGAVVTMKRKGRAPYVARFGPTEAKAMGLDGNPNYKKQAATMYQWRAVSMAARAVFPDVVLGLHTPEEEGAQVGVGAGGEQVVEELPASARPIEHEFVEGEIVTAEESAVSGDDPGSLKVRARELCAAMNEAGYQPKWTAVTLKTWLGEWYQAATLDALSLRDLTKVVADFEKKLAALQSEDEAERSLAGSRATAAVNRAGAQEGAAQ